MKRGFRGRMAFMALAIGAVAIALFSYVVMSLWNSILPAVIHVGTITFWQAVGILLLSKILFGGLPGGWGRRQHWKGRMAEKWQNMTPEQREKFQQQWKERCGHWGKTPYQEQSPNQETTNK